MPGDVSVAFREEGVLFLRGAFGREVGAILRDMVWRHIEQTTPVRLAAPNSWAHEGNFGLRTVEGRDMWNMVHTCGPLVDALDAIFGPDGWLPPSPPQILLSFPTRGPWRMPTGWHIDFGLDKPTWPVFALKMFALLDDVRPEGGGTLLLAGSHRLVEHLAMEHGRPVDPFGGEERLLDPLPAVRALLAGTAHRDQLGKSFKAHDMELRPVEITGQAGDIVLTHMHVFHSPAPNVTDRPRQMLANAFRSAPL